MPYNPKVDYCGPGRGWLVKLIPNEIGGVSINYLCYKHDVDWAADDPRYKKADKEFRGNLKEAFKRRG